MADLYSSTDDGVVYSTTDATWANARDDTSGTVTSATSGATANITAAIRYGGRGGGNTYKIFRSFMWFDTSGITGTVSAATIKIRGYSANDGSVIAVKSTAFGGDGGTALAAADLDAITGYSAGASLAGNATVYGPQILTSSWSTSGYNDFTGTSDLLADMQNNDAVIICFMDYTNDYLNSAVGSNAYLNCGAYFTDNTGTSKDPYIEYELSTGATVATVNGVAEASIATVKGVAHASISTVSGVTFD